MALVLLGMWQASQSVGWAAESLWLDAAKASITSSELHDHVSVLADDMLEGREAGSRGGREAAKYIIRRLETAGLQPAGSVFRWNDPASTDEKVNHSKGSFKQPFLMGHHNLLAVLPGSDPELKHEYIVVGAHYDHVGYGSRRTSYGPYGFIHNGADDNASGVSALLEVIDAFSQVDHRPRRSILFAFWDGEEKGLLGSKHWKRNPTVSLTDVRLAINIDMVGRMVKGRIEVGGTRSAQGVRRLLCRPAVSSPVLGTSQNAVNSGSPAESVPLWLDFNWEYKDNSDHWTFFEAGIPSLYLHTGLHDDYHRPSDDIEKLNIDGIRHVSGFLLEQLSKLADTETLPTFRSVARQESKLTQRQAEQPLLQLASRLDFYWEYIPSNPSSVVVHRVPQNSFAKQAGLVAGDRIVTVNGQPLTNESLLPALALQSDKAIELQLQREAEGLLPVTITLPLVGSPTRLGLSWRTDPAEPNAVYVTRVVPYSPADRAGIKLYDRFYTFNSTPIEGQDKLLARVQAEIERGVTELHYEVETRGVVREVTVNLELPTELSSDATL